MGKELTNRFSGGSQCGSRCLGDFKQSLIIRIIVAVRFSLIYLLCKGHTPLPILIKLDKLKNRKTLEEKSKYTPQILQAQSWNFSLSSVYDEQKNVFSPAAACQR